MTNSTPLEGGASPIGPTGNWRSYSAHALLLPYLDEKAIGDLVLKAVTENRRACEDGGGTPSDMNTAYPLTNSTAFPAFRCPTDSDKFWTHANNYAVCAGPTKLGGDKVTGADRKGAFNLGTFATMSDIRDGTSKTIMASEILTVNDSTVGNVDQKDLAKVREGNGVSGGNASPWSFPTLTEANVAGYGEACRALNSINGNRTGSQWYKGQYSRTAFNTLLKPNSPYPNCTFHCGGCNFDGAGLHGARSLHGGGVNAAMCDGAVRFLSNDIDWATYQRLGHVSDGQAIVDNY